MTVENLIEGDGGMRFGSHEPLQPAPDVVTLEITTRCNLACVMCPHGLPNGMPSARDAPPALVASLLANLDGLSEVHPTGVGEPLLADGFWQVVDALQGRLAPRIIIHTNGMLLTARNVERLIKAPISWVNVSVDAATPDTYSRIRGSEMRKTVDGARRLATALRGLRKNHPGIVRLSMVLMRENIAEAPLFIELANEVGAAAVYFEHLTETHMPKEKWTVYRGDFRFNYAEQSLLGEPESADPHIIKAMDVADRLGIRIDGREVLLDPVNLHHLSRPCRAGALVL